MRAWTAGVWTATIINKQTNVPPQWELGHPVNKPIGPRHRTATPSDEGMAVRSRVPMIKPLSEEFDDRMPKTTCRSTIDLQSES